MVSSKAAKSIFSSLDGESTGAYLRAILKCRPLTTSQKRVTKQKDKVEEVNPDLQTLARGVAAIKKSQQDVVS